MHREREPSFVAGDHVGEHDEPLERCTWVLSREIDRGADQMGALDVDLVVVLVRLSGQGESVVVAVECAERLAAQQTDVGQRFVESGGGFGQAHDFVPVSGARCGAGRDLRSRRRRLGEEPQDLVEPLVDRRPVQCPDEP